MYIDKSFPRGHKDNGCCFSPPKKRTTFFLQKSRVIWRFKLATFVEGKIHSTLGGPGELETVEVCFGEFHPNRWNDVWPVSSVHWACLPLGDWWKMESHWRFENDFFEQRLSDVVWEEVSDLSFFKSTVHRWSFSRCDLTILGGDDLTMSPRRTCPGNLDHVFVEICGPQRIFNKRTSYFPLPFFQIIIIFFLEQH